MKQSSNLVKNFPIFKPEVMILKPCKMVNDTCRINIKKDDSLPHLKTSSHLLASFSCRTFNVCKGTVKASVDSGPS
jgi:hypothetical protein